MPFLEPQFQSFLEEASGPDNKGGTPPPHGPDETTAHLFIRIVGKRCVTVENIHIRKVIGP